MNVITCYSNKNKVELLPQLNSIVTVPENLLQSLGSHLGLLFCCFDFLPDNYSWSDEVHQLKQFEAIY